MEAATALSCTLLPAIEPVLLVSWHNKAGTGRQAYSS
jgi:hypothetical protein